MEGSAVPGGLVPFLPVAGGCLAGPVASVGLVAVFNVTSNARPDLGHGIPTCDWAELDNACQTAFAARLPPDESMPDMNPKFTAIEFSALAACNDLLDRYSLRDVDTVGLQ